MITTVSIGPMRNLACLSGLCPPLDRTATYFELPEIPDRKTSATALRRAARGRRRAAGGERLRPCCGPCSASPKATSSASCCARAWARWPPGEQRCVDCGRTPLVGERVHRVRRRRAGLRAVPAAARRRTGAHRSSCTTPSAGTRFGDVPPDASPRGRLRAVDPVSVEITIARPREEVFEYLADIANHAEFNDHFMVDWRLTREDTYGYGAGARFRLKMPFNRFPWGDMTVIEVERPRRISRGRARRASSTASARSASTTSTRGRPARRACGSRCRPSRRPSPIASSSPSAPAAG